MHSCIGLFAICCWSAMKIALTGGRGFLGSHFLRFARAEKLETVSILRSESHNVSCDERPIGLDSSAALADAFIGCDAVLHCAGISHERGNQTFRRVHLEGTRNVLAACRQANVKKFVLTSFLRARPNCGSRYHESKWDAEQLVRQSGLDFTILKMGLIYGLGDQVTTQIGKVMEKVPLFGNLGWTDPKVRPVAVDDVVVLLNQCLTARQLSGITVPVLGPEELTLSEMVVRIAKQRDVVPIIFPLPVALHKILAWGCEKWMDRPLVTSAQVQMLCEGLSEATPPYQAMPEEFRPTTPFLGALGPLPTDD